MNTQKQNKHRTIMPLIRPNRMLMAVGILLFLSAFAFGDTPQVFQDFAPSSFSGTTSTDGIWRINGVWVGTGGNTMDPALAQLSSTYPGDSGIGFLSLSVAANELRGSEIQTMTLPGYGYGYYETRMKVTSVPGVCDSFFWIEAPNYGPHEWDIEFLTNESWITSPNSGMVHLTINYPGGSPTYALDLPFNPSLAFHRYGFLWTPGSIAYTVDGQIAYTFTDANFNTTAQGFIMMNTWTGNPYWGGGPPTQQATSVYDWVNFYPNVTFVPGSVQVTISPAGAVSRRGAMERGRRRLAEQRRDGLLASARAPTTYTSMPSPAGPRR